jgi:SPP1 family predicted phage head-tail adaptor
MIRAGELRQRVTIQTAAAGTDARWGTVEDWQDVDTVWAKVVPRAATEVTDAKGQQSTVTHDVTMRYRPDVTSKARLVWQGRTLEIVGVVDVDARKRELSIEATERPTNG